MGAISVCNNAISNKETAYVMEIAQCVFSYLSLSISIHLLAMKLRTILTIKNETFSESGCRQLMERPFFQYSR